MFDSLKTLFGDLLDGAEPESRFAENDYRLAAAALLVHAAAIDGEISAPEAAVLRGVLSRHFALDAAATDDLIARATQAEHEAVDLYRFTSLLKRSLNEAGRARIVEMMWQIVYADGRADEFEHNLLWRAADLLGVSSDERVALRRRVAHQGASG